MNPNIKAAAEAHAAETPDHFRSGTIGDFAAGAEYFQKESGIEQLRKALQEIVDYVYVPDMNVPKYSEMIDNAETALAKYLSFTKKEEDGK